MLLLQGFQIAAGLRTVLQREAGEKIRQWNQRKRRHGREGLLKYTESQTVAVRSALAEKLQTPGTDGEGYAKRFTALLKAAKHLPR